jgi:type II secretory pathway component PulJ
MKNISDMNEKTSGTASRNRRAAGFSLLELLVASLMFIVIGGAAFSMFAKNAPLFTQQQNTAALNIALQNVVSQMQLDLVNAGTGYYPGMLLPSWPTGVTIINQDPTTPCNVPATFTYTAACFDKLNILAINPSTPPTHPTDTTGGTASNNCSATAGTSSPTPTTGSAMAWDSSQNFYIQASPGLTLAQTAAGYKLGDQILLVQFVAGSGNVNGVSTGGATTVGTNGAKINSFVLTGAPVVGASYVALPFKAGNPTLGPLVNGVNVPPIGMNTVADDPLDITTSNTSQSLYYSFCGPDWVMKLDPITYQVSVANPADPTLTRTHIVNGVVNVDNIAEQIVGFKVGASVWGVSDSGVSTSTTLYNFFAQNTATASQVGYNSNFSLVRAVRVTLIGRGTPDPTGTFENNFDQGPYQILGTDVVINPRNMTMN